MNLFHKTRAVPSNFMAMYQLLSSKPGGRCRRESLGLEFLPEVLRGGTDSGAPLTETLALGTELKIWGIDGEHVSIAESNRRLGESAVREFVATATLQAAEDEADLNFLRTLAWMLAQTNPLARRLTPSVAESLVNDQGETEKFRFNETGFGQTVHWAAWLGFVELIGGATGMAVRLDPTRAVRGHLAALFESESKVAATEFLDRVSRVMPVFDGGWVRREVERLFPGLALEDSHVSETLSLALIRLQESGSIRMGSPSDATGVILGCAGEALKVSEIELLEGGR